VSLRELLKLPASLAPTEEMQMSSMAVENAVCETYDRLVEDCECAREQWN